MNRFGRSNLEDNTERFEELAAMEHINCNHLLLSIHNVESVNHYTNKTLYYEIHWTIHQEVDDRTRQFLEHECHLFEQEPLPTKNETYKVLKNLIESNRKWNEQNFNSILQISLNNGDIEYCTNNHLIDDIQLLCLIYLSLGSDANNILYQLKHKLVKELINFLISKYDLSINTDYLTTYDITKHITLPTIAAIFPQICCEYYSIGVLESPLAMDALRVNIKQKNCAIYCRQFPLVASKYLLQSKRNIFPQLLWIAVLLIEYDDQPKYDYNVVYMWECIKKAILPSILPEKIKFEKCVQWELVDENGKMSPFWHQSRDMCLYMLDHEFGHLYYWPNVRHELQCFYVPDDYKK